MEKEPKWTPGPHNVCEGTEMTPITGFLISADKDEQPKQLAELFCGLYADQQAAFFNEVAISSGAWDGWREFQWREMQKHLSVDGKRVVDEISEHTSDEDEAAQ